MSYDTAYVVAIDFDNTLTKGATYEHQGVLDKRAIRWVRRIQRLDVVTVLYTTRNGESLKDALRQLDGRLKFDYVNEYPARDSAGCKLNVDVYIDDKANDGKIRWLRTYLRIRRMVKRPDVR